MATLYGVSSSDSESEDEVKDDISDDISEFYPKPDKEKIDVREVLDENPKEWYVNYFKYAKDIQPFLTTNIIEEAKLKVYEDLGLNTQREMSWKEKNRAIYDDNIITFKPRTLLDGISKNPEDYLLDEYSSFGPAERLFLRYIYEIVYPQDLRAYTIASESDRGNFGKLGPHLAREMRKFLGKKGKKLRL